MVVVVVVCCATNTCPVPSTAAGDGTVVVVVGDWVAVGGVAVGGTFGVYQGVLAVVCVDGCGGAGEAPNAIRGGEIGQFVPAKTAAVACVGRCGVAAHSSVVGASSKQQST